MQLYFELSFNFITNLYMAQISGHGRDQSTNVAVFSVIKWGEI